MRLSRLVLVIFIPFLGASSVASVAQAPVAVSPGSADGALTEDRCPTFSWSQVDGARGYELVVYQLGEGADEAEPVLKQSFPNSVGSWTPSLKSCLERGQRYAWSVRAIRKREVSDWSKALLFRVASGPTPGEVKEALELVRQYFEGVEQPWGRDPGAASTPVAEETGGGPAITAAPLAALAPASGVMIADDGIWIDGEQVTTLADIPTCRRVGELLWCYDDLACGEACNDLCAAVGLVPIASDTVWFEAQDTLGECNAISEAFGLGETAEMTDWSLACLEDDFGTHAVGGGLLAPLRCTTQPTCPSNHRTSTDQLDVPCGINSRRAVCPCE